MTDSSPWPTHAPGTRARLAAGHAAGPTTARRTPVPAEHKQAEAIRAAITRGERVTPAMRMALGQYDLDHAASKGSNQ